MNQVISSGMLLKDIALTLSGHVVFFNLSLSLEAGQWHCILGRSGVGKSSLLRIMAGLQQPDHGTVSACDGKSLGRKVAYMSQDDGLLPWLSVLDNVQLGHRLRGGSSARTRKHATDLLGKVGLQPWACTLPDQLSGGMRQRVALARTLMEERPIVLMDEPFSKLDAVTRYELQTLACSLLQNRTVILVTHDPQEALRLGHTVTVLTGCVERELMQKRLHDQPLREFDSAAFKQYLPVLWAALQGEVVST